MRAYLAMFAIGSTAALGGCGDQWAECGAGTAKHIGQCMIIDGGPTLSCGPGTHEANGLCVPDSTTDVTPTISAVTPDHAGLSGGAPFTIQGHGFAGDTITDLVVKFGSATATVALASESTIVGVVPRGHEVDAPITVTTSKGTATTTFRYDALVAADGRGTNGDLYVVDPTNGWWVDIGPISYDTGDGETPYSVTALAFSSNGTLYAAATTGDLFTISPMSGEVTSVPVRLNDGAAMPAFSFVTDMKFSGETLYGLSTTGAFLTIDPATAIVTTVNTTGIDPIGGGIAVDATGAVIAATDAANHNLVSYDTTTGTPTPGALMDYPRAAPINSLAVIGTTLYGAVNDAKLNGPSPDPDSIALATIDPASGHVAVLFELPAVAGRQSQIDAIATAPGTVDVAKLATAAWQAPPANQIARATTPPCASEVAVRGGRSLHPAHRTRVPLASLGAGALVVTACGGATKVIGVADRAHFAIVGTRRGASKLVDTRTGGTVMRNVTSIAPQSR